MSTVPTWDTCQSPASRRGTQGSTIEPVIFITELFCRDASVDQSDDGGFNIMKKFAFALAMVGLVATPASATGSSHSNHSGHRDSDDRSREGQHHHGDGGHHDDDNHHGGGGHHDDDNHHGGGYGQGRSGGNGYGYGYGGSVGNISSSTSNSNNANNSSQNVANVSVTGATNNYHQRRIPVASAYSAPLTSGIDTCLGSATGAVQTGLFGLSLGKTNHDKTCERIKLARELNGIGFLVEGCEVLRQDPRIAAAFAATGRTCAAQLIVPSTYYPPIIHPPVRQTSRNRRGERG